MLAFYNMVFPLNTIVRTKSVPGREAKPLFHSPSRSDARSKRNREKGAGHLKAVVWTSILVLFIYVAAMMLPVLINEYQFQDSIQNIARYASANRRGNDQVRQAVLDEAQKEDLPIQAQDIKVEGNAGNIHINVDYSVTVDLKFYQWTLNFHPAADNGALF